MQRNAIVVAGLALALSASAANASPTYGPILGRGLTGDQMLVHWGTAATTTPTVQYRLKGATAFQSVTGAGQCSGANCDWEALIPGLASGSVYEYQVPSDTNTHEFQTCPSAGMPMDVVFYGDSRDGEPEHAKIVASAIAQMPDIVFESGDIQADGSYAGYLTNFFVTASALVSTVPFMAVPGNHDANQITVSASEVAQLKANYARLFPTPGNTLNSSTWQSHYAFVCGGSMFIGLDSNIVSATDAQGTFLANQLAAAKSDASIDHVFVWMHHGAYSPGQHGDTLTVQSAWVPLFSDPANKVAVVFSGHDHIYAHMNDGSPVAYFVSGGAGAPPYSLTSTSKATTVKAVGGASEYNFVKVHIAGAAVSATAYNDSGTVIETWNNGAGSGGGGGTGGGGGSSAGGGGSGGGGTSGGGGGGATGGGGGSGGGSGMSGGGGGAGGSGQAGMGGNAGGGGANSGSGGCNVAQSDLGGLPTVLSLVFFGLLLRRRRARS